MSSRHLQQHHLDIVGARGVTCAAACCCVCAQLDACCCVSSLPAPAPLLLAPAIILLE
jgi:hypothetical protein